jgi:hypothetical protein
VREGTEMPPHPACESNARDSQRRHRHRSRPHSSSASRFTPASWILELEPVGRAPAVARRECPRRRRHRRGISHTRAQIIVERII